MKTYNECSDDVTDDNTGDNSIDGSGYDDCGFLLGVSAIWLICYHSGSIEIQFQGTCFEKMAGGHRKKN